MNKKGVGPVLGYIGMGVLIAGVAVFLGGHSLNFFQISFSKGQQAYAPLGLLLTEGGLFIWLGIFLWVAKSALQKGIALIMLLVSLIGGMATAVFDIYFETASGSIGYQLTIEEIKAMSMVIGALAVAHGLAMIGELAGNKIIEAFGDADGDGVPNYRDSDYKRNRPQTPQPHSPPKSTVQSSPKTPQPVNSTSYTLPAFLSASGINSEHAFGAFLNETDGPGVGWKVLRDGLSADGYKLPQGITHKNFDELAGKVHSNGRVKDF